MDRLFRRRFGRFEERFFQRRGAVFGVGAGHWDAATALSWAAGVPALADDLGAQVRDRGGERTAGRTRRGTCPIVHSVLGRTGFEREPKTTRAGAS